jgi:vacuolar protein-sorting-associated protein 4
MYVDFKNKGIELAKQAVEADGLGEVDRAVDLYIKALEYFKAYLKYEKNEKAVKAFKEKVRVWGRTRLSA